jgi:alkaline phosphatase
MAALGLGATATPALAAGPGSHARHQGGSVIILSGDGMGPAQRTLIQYVNYGNGGRTQPMDALPFSGVLGTSPDDPKEAVTDSAAGATAWAIGRKTVNGYEGLGPDGKPRQTLLEYAKTLGKSTALIEDHDVSNATMAAFASHIADRDKKGAIIRQYLTRTKPDVMFGGGEKYWYPKGDPGRIPDSIEDPSEGDANFVDQAVKRGYQYAWDRASFAKLTGPKALALVKDDPIQANLYQGFPLSSKYYVPESQKVAKALDIVGKNRKGFFMIIDFDEIDDGGHDHDARVIARSGQELNRTVAVIRRYQRTHPNTLLISTADHETGGMTIENLFEPQTDSAPDDPVPNEDDRSTAVNFTLKGGKFPPASGPFTIKGTTHRFKTDWTTPEHTGTNVPVTAAGPLAHRLSGSHENTYLNTIAKQVLRRR